MGKIPSEGQGYHQSSQTGIHVESGLERVGSDGYRGDFVRVVAKFGGTSLGSGDRIARAADSIEAAVANGHEIAVVASAMGSTTDELIDDITFQASDADRAEIVSMGERTSVRMVKAALTARGVDATFVEPGDPEWPVVTDEYGEVDVSATQERTEALVSTLDETVPVITGFLAEGPDGAVSTLGRGGSDTTAVMLGSYMDADEVVIVTDVEGVMTGDPHAVEGARNVGEISVDELRNLSFRGAEVVAPSALSYKDEALDVRVVHYQHGDLLTGGTTIEGTFENLIDLRERPLACLTVAGRSIRNESGVFQSLAGALGDADINIDVAASGLDSITLYVDAEEAGRAENILHQQVIERPEVASVTVDEPLAIIRLTGGELPTQPGVIHEIVDPFAEERIQIHDLVTSATSVAIVVAWSDRERSLELVQDLF